MENASKALLIAGSMLITIIILGVLVMAWNNMRELPKTQEQIKEAEELATFNKKYESYAKNNIRGSDIVTVVNMAVNNNEKYSGQADMQINIHYKITKPIDEVIRKYVLQNGEWKLINTSDGIALGTNDYTNDNLSYSNANGTLSFKEFSEVDSKSVEKYSVDRVHWYLESDVNKEEMAKKGCYYTKTNVGAEFRRKKFNCTDVKYNENGRISEIYYEEK